MNKLTLIIDGNWLAMSRTFALTRFFKADNADEVKEEGRHRLTDLLATSICGVLNKFPDVDNIIIVRDGGSWRNQLDRPKGLDEVYKGNREGSFADMDFRPVWAAFEDLVGKAKGMGLTVASGRDCEGDDWIWYFTDNLVRTGCNCLIWSADADLTQLVRRDALTGRAVLWFNEKKLVCPDVMEEKDIDPVEFLLTPPSNANTVADTLIHSVKDVEYINPDEVVMAKIICGDNADNIKSVVRYPKGGRMIGVGPKEWEKVAKALDIHTMDDFHRRLDDIINTIINPRAGKGVDGKYLNKEAVKDMVRYNEALVRLHRFVIPERIVGIMEGCEYKKSPAAIDDIRHNYKVLVGTSTDIENIFNEAESLPF